MKNILLAVAFALLCVSGVRADGVTAYVLTQQLTFTNGGSFTEWTFLAIDAPNNPFPTFQLGTEANGATIVLPFAFTASQGTGPTIMDVPNYSLGVFAPGPFETTLFSYVQLTDTNGFISGLPLECSGPVGTCENFILADSATNELNWLDNNLPSSSPGPSSVPESGTLSLVSGALAGMGFLKRRFLR